ncbi:MAG TPA: peptidoglycan DD-metalloendopeptidase family protein [Longilinea sp.]|nr:peptidoglycan DD-metalloendopeptidase family protein [Longilinea sp.]
MNIRPTSQDPSGEDGGKPIQQNEQDQLSRPAKGWGHIWETLVRMGLGESSTRIGTGLFSVMLVLVVAWVMSDFYLGGQVLPFKQEAAQAASIPTPTPVVQMPSYDTTTLTNSVSRQVDIHTNLPSHPRFDILEYTVQQGDTIFSIADKFGLKPETILFGNRYTLLNPEFLSVGQTLQILPVDGEFYIWNAGDGLTGVASYFGVTPDDIINWPGNHLDAATIGDLSHPNIKAGTQLVIPGGTQAITSWSASLMISRTDPASAKIYGAGYCGKVYTGEIGTGTFIWPTANHTISGYDYTPPIHPAIDIGAHMYDDVVASDGGVIVYDGWNDAGYGNVIVIDHGNGWQTLYAHLSQMFVSCGDSVNQGQKIGAIGVTGNSTGPHLHFEIRNASYGTVNPHQYLPAP